MNGIRPARDADLDALCELETLCFGGQAWSRSLVEAELDAGNRLVRVAEEADGAVAGYVSTMLAGTSADLLRIAVHPGRRRTGLGRALLESTLTALTAPPPHGRAAHGSAPHGCEEVLLEVDSRNQAARRLYESFGFEQVSVRRGYYDGGRGDALLLKLDLLARHRGR